MTLDDSDNTMELDDTQRTAASPPESSIPWFPTAGGMFATIDGVADTDFDQASMPEGDVQGIWEDIMAAHGDDCGLPNGEGHADGSTPPEAYVATEKWLPWYPFRKKEVSNAGSLPCSSIEIESTIVCILHS